MDHEEHEETQRKNKMMAQTKKPSSPFKPIPLEVEAIGKKVLDTAYTVHTDLGPGLLESVYEACLAYELRKTKPERRHTGSCSGEISRGVCGNWFEIGFVGREKLNCGIKSR